ncbi:MAG: hypothetical protein GXN99_00245, partial [Candidatus Nanohaloarchaeota archaeon]|nr:hypothetical protein [Candidatus Nanohaloarchaeota archaeon]
VDYEIIKPIRGIEVQPSLEETWEEKKKYWEKLREVFINIYGEAFYDHELPEYIEGMLRKYFNGGLKGRYGSYDNLGASLITCADAIGNYVDRNVRMPTRFYDQRAVLGALWAGDLSELRIYASHAPTIDDENQDTYLLMLHFFHQGFVVDEETHEVLEEGKIYRPGQRELSDCCGAFNKLYKVKKGELKKEDLPWELKYVYDLFAKPLRNNLDLKTWYGKLRRQNIKHVKGIIREYFKGNPLLSGISYLPFLNINVALVQQGRSQNNNRLVDLYVPLGSYGKVVFNRS